MADDGKKEILTLNEVAERLRCSKSHAAKLLSGQVRGVPPLTHMQMGRRKVVLHEWLIEWVEARKRGC